MALSVLVLHGPNLAAIAREEVNPLLQQRAPAGVTFTFVQANGEEGLLDGLHAHAASVDAVLVNPGVLAPTAFALAEGLSLVALPAVEVLLAVPRGKSALTGVVRAQLQGGVEVYLEGLTALGAPAAKRPGRGAGKRTQTSPPPVAKTLGRSAAAALERSPATPRGKSIGRRGGSAASGGLSTDEVRRQLTLRLQGKVDAVSLARWARESYARLDTAAPASRDVLEDALLTLMAAKADDTALVALLAKLQA